MSSTLKFSSIADFPGTGSANVIYIDTTGQAYYRWDGSQYLAYGCFKRVSDPSNEVKDQNVLYYFNTNDAYYCYDGSQYCSISNFDDTYVP